MLRRTTLVGALALVTTALVPAASAQITGPAQPSDSNRYVNLQNVDETSAPKAFKDLKPDSRTQVGGATIEIYTSMGDSEGAMDWRTINLFSYLVNSVPKYKHSYTTLFNSLYDDRNISYSESTDRWNIAVPNETFAPVAAYLNQANKYANPADESQAEADRREYINVLGAKESIDEAYAANSSLARLVRAGYKSSRPKAVNYQQCGGAGGCITYTGSDTLMHSKYGAFEQAADSTGAIRDHVVFITSSNLNGSSGSKKTNTSIVIYGDKSAYDAVKYDIYGTQNDVATGDKSISEAVNATRPQKGVWEAGDSTSNDGATYKDAMAVNSAGVANGIPTDSGVTLYPSPRGNSTATVDGMDAEARFLEQQASTNPVKNSSCKVYAVHSLFNSTRNGIRSALATLAQQGCDVHVVLGTNAISDIIDGYFTMSTELRDVIDRVEFANVHDKAYSYQYNGTNMLFGGSTNFTGTSLEYDELAFSVPNAASVKAAADHYEYVYQLAKSGTKWAVPTGVAISPSGSLKVRQGQQLKVTTKVSPSNGLVSNTEWSSTNSLVASVDATGVITGHSPGTAQIKVETSTPSSAVKRTDTATVTVTADGSTSTGAKDQITVAPTLSMDRYQSPGGTTHITVTWGNGEHDYQGVVKLQYYSGGSWRTYSRYINTNKRGTGRLAVSFAGSKTWRAYGAALTGVYKDEQPVNISNITTAKNTSAWSINTVRTKTATTTPRLYATNLAKVGKVPMLVAWNKPGGKFRLQMRSSGGSWKTHSSYKISGTQSLIAIPIANTKYWRIATSTGSTKVSNTVKISMR